MKDNTFELAGNLNVSILESFMATLMILIEEDSKILSPENVLEVYKKKMYNAAQRSVLKEEENPFTTSTGTIKSMDKRFVFMKIMLSGSDK